MTWPIFERLVRRQQSVPVSQEDRTRDTRDRLIVIMVGVVAVFAIVQARLTYLGMNAIQAGRGISHIDPGSVAVRPEIRDRHGRVMALDIEMRSLYADPRVVQRPEETYDALVTVLPDLDRESTLKKLRNRRLGFIWLRREITPAQQQNIIALGLPGIDFRSETRRFYPGGRTASQILGHTDVDNRGKRGFEAYLDRQGLDALQSAGLAVARDLEPVTLSVDMRVQHALRETLREALEKYSARATLGVVLNVHTGEVVALSSLPDFDPNDPVEVVLDDRLNRVTHGLYEMGSTFKTFTTAMALDSGRVSLGSKFDARGGIQLGRHRVGDYKGKNRVLSVPEIFIYSSNIGTAKMAEIVGMADHRAFLEKIGIARRLKEFELPETARPRQPRRWRRDSAVTISYGHGLSTTPLNTAMAAAAMVNGGKLIPPTLMPRSRFDATQIAERVIDPETSRKIRYLMRLNVLKGSGKRADVPGYQIGGKTGTSNKLVGGKYSSKISFNSFLSTFPATDPQYVVLISIDEPKPVNGSKYSTAGLNAAPAVGELISKIAPILGVKPDFQDSETSKLATFMR